MFGRDDEGDECTAAPGVLGNRACDNYPGCGCGGSSYDEENEHEDVFRRLARGQFEESVKEPPPNIEIRFTGEPELDGIREVLDDIVSHEFEKKSCQRRFSPG